MSKYFYRIYGVNFGPVPLEILQYEIASGQLTGGHEVRREDETSWTRIDDLIAEGLSHLIPSTETTQSTPTSEPDDVDARTMWYVRMGRAEHGPIEFQKLREMVAAGRILPIDRVRQSDQAEWTPAQAIPDLFSSNSRSVPGGSSILPWASRPSHTEPTGSMPKGHLQQAVPLPSATSAPLQHASEPSSQPKAPAATDFLANDSANSQRRVPQEFTSSPDLKAESTPQSTLPRSPLTHPEEVRNDGVTHLPKPPKSGPYPKFQGESKPKTGRGETEQSQPIISWNLILALAGCLLIIFIGRSLKPAEVGQFENPMGELSAAYHALDKERSENPNGEVKAIASKEFVDKLDATKQRITNLYTEHDIRLILLTLSDNLVWAAKSETNDELTTYMEVSRHLLNSATKEMQKWKDELARKSSKK